MAMVFPRQGLHKQISELASQWDWIHLAGTDNFHGLRSCSCFECHADSNNIKSHDVALHHCRCCPATNFMKELLPLKWFTMKGTGQKGSISRVWWSWWPFGCRDSRWRCPLWASRRRAGRAQVQKQCKPVLKVLLNNPCRNWAACHYLPKHVVANARPELRTKKGVPECWQHEAGPFQALFGWRTLQESFCCPGATPNVPTSPNWMPGRPFSRRPRRSS